MPEDDGLTLQADQMERMVASLERLAKNQGNGSTQKLGMQLITLAVVALVTAVIWHEVRIGVIESNRFTEGDAAAMEAEIREDMPPNWYREVISGSLSEIARRLELLERVP